MKKLILAALFLFLTVPAFSANIYVRNDGGTDSQCDGTTDAAVSGAPNCGYINIMYAYKNYTPGDVIIVDERDHAGGSPVGKAAYCVGYGCPGYEEGTGGCSAGAQRNCNPWTLEGTGEGTETKVRGRNYATCDSIDDAPELYGVGGVEWVLRHTSHFDLECVDITDHSEVGEYGVIDTNGVSYGQVFNSGNWARNGILNYQADNVYYNNVWVHGLAKRAIDQRRPLTQSLNNLHVISGSHSNWEIDFEGNSTPVSNVTVTGVEGKWAGCLEKWPLVTTDPADSSNHMHCCSQGQSCYGDNIFAADTGGNSGTWVFRDFEFAYNVSDNVDFLYKTGGDITFDQGISHSSPGNVFKTGGSFTTIENSIASGNCEYFKDQPFTATTASHSIGQYGCELPVAQGGLGGTWVNPPGYCIAPFDHCRASGDPIAFAGGDWENAIRNTTIFGESNVLILTKCEGGTCSLTLENVLTASAEKWNSPAAGPAEWNYCDVGCGNLSQTISNVHVYNNRGGCPSSAVSCADPLFNDTTDYTDGTPGHVYDFTLQAGSPVIDESGGTITLLSPDEDRFGCARDSNYDIGAIEYPNNETCAGSATQCSDGADNDSDGLTDYPNDPGCTSFSDNDETDPASPQCNDGSDNDADGYTDYPNDPGCTSATDDDESDDPECSDGLDNDSDGDTDYPADADCVSIFDNNETYVPACGDSVTYCNLCADQSACGGATGCEWSLEQGIEDFVQNYTEIDAGSNITVANNSATISAIQKGAESYLRRDFVGENADDFIHKFTTTITSMDDGSRVGVWGVNNGSISLYDMLTTPSLGFALTYNYQDLSGATRYQWRLNESAASASVADDYGSVTGTLKDNSGNINTSTIATTGKLNGGFTFNGSTSGRRVDYGATTPLEFQPDTEYSCGAWVNTSSALEQSIISVLDCGSGCPGWAFEMDGGRLVFFTIADIISGDGMGNSSVATYNSGTWRFVGFTYDGTKSADGVNFFVDGAEVTADDTADTMTNNISFANGRLCVGARCYGSTANTFFTGTIDQPFCVDRVLTAGEWSSLYNSGTGTESLTGTSGEWKLESFTDAEHSEIYQTDSYSESTLPMTRYPTITRTGTGITAKIYSDAGRTTLLDTLTLSATPTDPFQYAYAFINSGFPGEVREATLSISDLDLGGSYACVESGTVPTCADDCTYCFTQQGCQNTGTACDWCSDDTCVDSGGCPATPPPDAFEIFSINGNFTCVGAGSMQ